MKLIEGKMMKQANRATGPGLFTGISLIILPVLLFCSSFIFAQTGVNTDTPDASSAIEIYSTNKGILIPRVTLTASLNNPSPVTSPAIGLLVFNNGANQPMGFYYWSGSQWTSTGAASPTGDYWSLTGNAGTAPGTNFIGTTDAQDFLLYTNGSERMNIESDGQIIIGNASPFNSGDMFTVVGVTGMDNAINAYSPDVGFYADADRIGLQTFGGKYGVASTLDTNLGFAIYGKNTDPAGYGIIALGNNAPAQLVSNHYPGLFSIGDDGAVARAQGASKTGIIATGNGLMDVTVLPTGSGAAFAGYHGTYTLATNSLGIGIIGVGNNYPSMATLTTGCGGAFTGYHGAYGFATNTAGGTGVVGLGNNGATYGILATGSGGAFTGRDGLYAKAVNATVGTGIIAIGNNYSGQYSVHPSGSGGAFTGFHGLIANGYEATGTGVIGMGNNGAYSTLTSGSGGAFSANVCGVYGYAINSANDRYGGYFATGGGLYVYVGGRYSNTNRKIVGTGNVSTIVKDTQGNLITLTCPEAPEVVFHDYGIGQLVDGRAHITIDPDLSINIQVSEDHPLKVYITPEGDCNGVYVANKSANGFDVIELMGGASDVSFAWQIVATRANEENVLSDGSVEISDNSQRFQPAPGPLGAIMESAVNGESTSRKSAVNQQVTFTSSVEDSIIQVGEPGNKTTRK
jgi:hypothetical protein